MKKEESLANHETELEGSDFVELGRVSEETQGGAFGHSWDGGFGVKFP
jgi:hypothetical protein